MREILFKAKRKNWNELPKEQQWIEGYLVKKLCGRYTTCGFEEFEAYVIVEVFSDGVTMYAYIDESTICQYTGLTDKNGRKIWENDIVKYHFGDDVAPIRFGEYQSCFDSIKAGHIGFYVDWDSKKALRKDLGYWVNMIDCNVIGNVFDNPELLKGGAG